MNKTASFTTSQLADLLGCRLEGKGDVVIRSLAPIEDASSDQLTFVANPSYRRFIPNCQAGAIIISPDLKTPSHIERIVADDPYSAFRKALELLYPPRHPDIEPGIHPKAEIDPTATIGKGVSIAPFVHVTAGAVIGDGTMLYTGSYVGQNCTIGENCIIGVGAVLRHDVIVGNRVVVGDRSVIGFDGFGYVPGESGFVKIPQVGTVELEDDVEIGAGTCIDRAAVGTTRIGKGTKLDNLIQVAHGVQIGRNCGVAAQTGISGSAHIGSGVLIGGQAGFVGHIDIGDGMIIGAQAGVTKSFDIKGMVSGYPAKPHMKEVKLEAALNRLPELLKRVKELEKKLED